MRIECEKTKSFLWVDTNSRKYAKINILNPKRERKKNHV